MSPLPFPLPDHTLWHFIYGEQFWIFLRVVKWKQLDDHWVWHIPVLLFCCCFFFFILIAYLFCSCYIWPCSLLAFFFFFLFPSPFHLVMEIICIHFQWMYFICRMLLCFHDSFCKNIAYVLVILKNCLRRCILDVKFTPSMYGVKLCKAFKIIMHSVKMVVTLSPQDIFIFYDFLYISSLFKW